MSELMKQEQPVKAAFYFQDFKFTEAHLKFDRFDEEERSMKFDPSGVYNSTVGTFELKFILTVYDKKIEDYVLKATLIANFKFNQVLKFEDVPQYFYRNSIAIIFPYVRAFASNISLQANTGSMLLLPTLNLSSLEKTLMDNTTVKTQ